VSCNLHKIKSSIWVPADVLDTEPVSKDHMKTGHFIKPILTPPKDAIELCERIGLFWMVRFIGYKHLHSFFSYDYRTSNLDLDVGSFYRYRNGFAVQLATTGNRDGVATLL
jgi:hypothetical protein